MKADSWHAIRQSFIVSGESFFSKSLRLIVFENNLPVGAKELPDFVSIVK
jgi:hypothetical protein